MRYWLIWNWWLHIYWISPCLYCANCSLSVTSFSRIWIWCFRFLYIRQSSRFNITLLCWWKRFSMKYFIFSFYCIKLIIFLNLFYLICLLIYILLWWTNFSNCSWLLKIAIFIFIKCLNSSHITLIHFRIIW